MINLRVLVPEATENYIQNPQFRYATTGWTTVGATLTRTLDYARFGIASGKVVTNGAALGEGIYYRVSNLSGISDVITVSVYLRGNVGDEKVRLRLQDDPTGFEWTTTVVELRTDRWIRVEVTGRCTGGNDIRLKVETADNVARAYTFYVDGAQMERKAYSTTYCDGDQSPNCCRWNLTAHASNSTRTADSRDGGRWIPLAGPCRPNNNIYVTVLGGFGDPPVQNNIQSWATAPGSFFQSQKILDRVVTLNFTVKNEKMHAKRLTELSMSGLHNLRQQLVDLFKTNKTLNDEAFWFEYSDTDSDKPLYIRMRYEAGLEGSWDVRNGWFNTFAVRLISVDPLWTEDTQEVAQTGASVTYNSATDMGIWGRINMEWSKVQSSAGITLSGGVLALAQAPDGTVYAGGLFTNNGLTRVAKWNGSQWTVMGNNGANGTVRGLSVAADGTVYAVGDFTVIGGVACNRVAKYNPVTDTWSALSSGLNGSGSCVLCAPNGQVYIGGSFSTAGGTAMNYGITRWDGLQFRTVGNAFFNSTTGAVAGIANGNDGKNIYIVGDFLQNSDGTAQGGVGRIDLSTNLIYPVGYGFNSGAQCVAVGLDGTIYAGGAFTTGGSFFFTGVVDTANRLRGIAKYVGGQNWLPMGAGFDQDASMGGAAAQTYCLAVGKNGEIYAGGNWTTTGGKYLFKIAKWYSETWNPLSLITQPNTTNANIITALLQHTNGDLYVGEYANSGTPYVAVIPKTTTINNPGTASVWPILYIAGPGTLRYIANLKTGQEIFTNLPVFSGEEVFIDFARGKIYSTARGDLLYTILPGSEIRLINLLPGQNKFAVLITNDVGAVTQLGFVPCDWSADAVVNAKDLE